MANDNINSFEKCQRKPPGTFPCQSVGARSSQLDAPCSSQVLSPTVAWPVVIFVVFATAIVGNSNKRTTNVVGVAEMAENAWKWVAAG